jgi:hypothetical protein
LNLAESKEDPLGSVCPLLQDDFTMTIPKRPIPQSQLDWIAIIFVSAFGATGFIDVSNGVPFSKLKQTALVIGAIMFIVHLAMNWIKRRKTKSSAAQQPD